MNHFREKDLFFQKKCSMEDILKKEKPIIGIHGIRGAFTEQSLYQFMSKELSIDEEQYITRELIHSKNVLQAIENNTIDFGIFAFANSGSGGYVASLEAMGKYRYELLALFVMPICMCLIGHPDIKDTKEIQEFRGHPVAMTMCRNTLASRYPNIPLHPDTDEMDTALSVQFLMKGKLGKHTGVFASERAAQIYGARLLQKGIHDDPNNATFFAFIKKQNG
jgi:prephenate dehydratase